MKQNRILFTGFKKAHENNISSSAILLEKISDEYGKFLLTMIIQRLLMKSISYF